MSVSHWVQEKKKTMETTDTTSCDIGDLNLNYLALAQRLIAKDSEAAMHCLDISVEAAYWLVNLTDSQMAKFSKSSHFLCGLRVDHFSALSEAMQDPAHHMNKTNRTALQAMSQALAMHH